MEKNPTATVSFTSTSHHQQKMNKKKGKKKIKFCRFNDHRNAHKNTMLQCLFLYL